MIHPQVSQLANQIPTRKPSSATNILDLKMALNNQQQQQHANNNTSHIRQSNRYSYTYTYHLPYGVRRDICNLLDADQSWRTLGGQFIGLDATQLTLIGQAYLRCSSPTDELLHRLDSANVRISDFCFYLEQMNHCRALEILKPYLDRRNARCYPTDHESSTVRITAHSEDTSTTAGASQTTLATPTPSFSERPPALMDCNDDLGRLMVNADGDDQYWLPQLEHDLIALQQQQQQDQQQQQLAAADNQPATAQAPKRCHNLALSSEQAPSARPIERRSLQPNKAIKLPDPGEEIVRMACANNRKRTSISDQEVVNQLRLIMQITYNELKQASNNFSDTNILGNGGFASVYRGNWKGTDVAIKRLKCNLMDQALNELTILNSYRIDNILPIYGISIDGPEACLVYQFMANGSLEDRLSCKKGTPALTWAQRALIGEGVAKGLYYLHTLRDKPLVHGDVKSANVLLDSQFVPKLGDFGLARQVFKGKNPQTELCTHCTVSSIHGTSVYLPPEYLRHKILSPAVDVYSYGIVLLEMATGKRAYDGKRLLIDLVQDETQSMSKGEISYSLKDSRLADDTQSDLKIWFELLIKLGLGCAHKIKKKRPDMGHVLNRFVEFRTSSELALKEGGHQMQLSQQATFTLGSLRGSSSVAAGSTKPLHAADTTGQQQQQQQPQLQQLNQYQSPRLLDKPANAGQPGGIQVNNAIFNSNLMSVEEEQPAQTNHQEVDAMIPLLTELGVETTNQ